MQLGDSATQEKHLVAKTVLKNLLAKMANLEMKITLKQTTVVLPAKNPEITTVQLTGIDCIMPRYPIGGCFFFKPPANTDTLGVFNQMAETLRLMLAR